MTAQSLVFVVVQVQVQIQIRIQVQVQVQVQVRVRVYGREYLREAVTGGHGHVVEDLEVAVADESCQFAPDARDEHQQALSLIGQEMASRR